MAQSDRAAVSLTADLPPFLRVFTDALYTVRNDKFNLDEKYYSVVYTTVWYS